MAESHERVGTFWKFCFEVVHFAAKVTNAVHWFSGSYSEKTKQDWSIFFGNYFGEGR